MSTRRHLTLLPSATDENSRKPARKPTGPDPKYAPYRRDDGSIDWSAYNTANGIVEQSNPAADAAAERIRGQIRERGWVS